MHSSPCHFLVISYLPSTLITSPEEKIKIKIETMMSGCGGSRVSRCHTMHCFVGFTWKCSFHLRVETVPFARDEGVHPCLAIWHMHQGLAFCTLTFLSPSNCLWEFSRGREGLYSQSFPVLWPERNAQLLSSFQHRNLRVGATGARMADVNYKNWDAK